jgi:hypothetical protein
MNTNISAMRILIYGDSFVFGVIPGGGGARYDASTRYLGCANYSAVSMKYLRHGRFW